MSDSKNINLNQFSSKKEYPPLERTATLVKAPEDYSAVEDTKRNRSTRFRIIDEEGKSYGCSYSYLISWVYEPSTLITLTISDKVFLIEGQNLGKIDRLLLDEKVKTLRVFNPLHHKPAAKGETLIERITVS